MNPHSNQLRAGVRTTNTGLNGTGQPAVTGKSGKAVYNPFANQRKQAPIR